MASAFRILGEGQLSLTKFLIATDQPVDLKDFRATLEHLLARTHPETDLYVFSNLSMDTLDYTGPGGEQGIERRVAGTGRPGPRAARAVPAAGAAAVGASRRARVLRAAASSSAARRFADDPGAAGRLAAHPAFAGWPLLVVTDEPERAARERRSISVDDVHALRAGARHPRRGNRARATSRHLHAAGRHRRAPEARISRTNSSARPTSPTPSRGDGGSTFPLAGWRWATRVGGAPRLSVVTITEAHSVTRGRTSRTVIDVIADPRGPVAGLLLASVPRGGDARAVVAAGAPFGVFDGRSARDRRLRSAPGNADRAGDLRARDSGAAGRIRGSGCGRACCCSPHWQRDRRRLPGARWLRVRCRAGRSC